LRAGAIIADTGYIPDGINVVYNSACIIDLEMQEPMSCRHTLDPTSHRRIDRSIRSLIASFGYAFAGVWYMVRTQRNAQIHILVGACAVALGFVLGLERWEWLAIVLIITLVLAAEGVNTAVESAVDLATSSCHPLAKVAKDVAAGTVLICAVAAVIVGCLVFLPHILSL
jgi:diacylglycerol kinase